jgi:hypothetical protein
MNRRACTPLLSRLLRRGLAGILLGGLIGFSPSAMAASDYPTEALADYVFACMASNGETREMLQRCSCSIDVVASIIPYEKYVQAETILSMNLVGGERMAVFRDPIWTQEVVADLRRAQAEGEIRCF